MSSLLELGLIPAASFELAERAFYGVEQDYDPNNGRWKQPYHNQFHTMDVFDNAVALANAAFRNGKIDATTVSLVGIAAAWHDRFYETYNEANEEISAEMAIMAMGDYEVFTDDHKDAVWRYIMATQVESFFPKVIQSADVDFDYGEGIVADADLANFGYDPTRFLKHAFSYLKEINLLRNPLSTMKYLSDEQVLLANHDWYTEEAADLFPHCRGNIAAVRSAMTLHASQ